jgi:hypothetical protein
MVELDRLVKLLVEKVLRSSKKMKPSRNETDEAKAAGNEPQKSDAEEPAKDKTDEKMPEG